MMPQQYLTRQEAADLLRCHVLTIDRRIADGSLTTYHLGRKVLLDPRDLRKLLVRSDGGDRS